MNYTRFRGFRNYCRGCRKIKMALFKTGSFLFKCLHPTAVNPLFVIPSTLNIQSRNAKRKGYREKLKQKKKAAVVEEVKPVSFVVRNKKVSKFIKTVELPKPEVPDDDIIILDNFKHMKFSLSDAVKLHREYHHPTIFNNPNSYVVINLEFNMVGKKLTQVMKPFSGVAPIPHPFIYKFKKEILVFCADEYKELALESGASVAGGSELIKKVKGGVVQLCLYDYVICHIDFLQELTPIRGLLKTNMPKARLGTLTNDLKSAIKRFLHGVEYAVDKPGPSQDFGVAEAPIGTIDMPLEHLEENFKSLLADIMEHKPPREGDFVSWIWCKSPPSSEKFSIDLSLYIQGPQEGEIDDDGDEELTPEQQEKLKIKKLKMEAS